MTARQPGSESNAVRHPSLEDVFYTKKPIFIAAGTRDKKAVTEGADAFVIEVLRKQRNRKLEYINYPQLNHDYLNSKGKDFSQSVFGDYVKWTLEKSKQRSFKIKRF